jgi:hypothetical protein
LGSDAKGHLGKPSYAHKFRCGDGDNILNGAFDLAAGPAELVNVLGKALNLITGGHKPELGSFLVASLTPQTGSDRDPGEMARLPAPKVSGIELRDVTASLASSLNLVAVQLRERPLVPIQSCSPIAHVSSHWQMAFRPRFV